MVTIAFASGATAYFLFTRVPLAIQINQTWRKRKPTANDILIALLLMLAIEPLMFLALFADYLPTATKRG